MMAVGTDKQTARRRCDSPAPRAAEPTEATETQLKSNEAPPSHVSLLPPPLSIAAITVATVLCGRASYLMDSEEEPHEDTLTWTALVAFVTMGAAIMHFDFIEFSKEEQREGKKSHVSLRIGAGGQRWLFFTSSSVLLLGILYASRTLSQWIVPVASSMLLEALGLHPQSDSGDPVSRRCLLRASEAPHWRTTVHWSDEAAIFVVSAVLLVGLALSRMDFMDMFQKEQEASEQVPSSAEKSKNGSHSRTQWRLYACVGLFVAACASAIPLLTQTM